MTIHNPISVGTKVITAPAGRVATITHVYPVKMLYSVQYEDGSRADLRPGHVSPYDICAETGLGQFGVNACKEPTTTMIGWQRYCDKHAAVRREQEERHAQALADDHARRDLMASDTARLAAIGITASPFVDEMGDYDNLVIVSVADLIAWTTRETQTTEPTTTTTLNRQIAE